MTRGNRIKCKSGWIRFHLINLPGGDEGGDRAEEGEGEREGRGWEKRGGVGNFGPRQPKVCEGSQTLDPDRR